MKMSVREARAQFAHALAAAERGERVTITKNGRAIAELGPAPDPQPIKKSGFDWDRLARVRKEMGLDKYDGPPLDEAWRGRFDDPAWGRELFGLDDDGDPKIGSTDARYAHPRLDDACSGTTETR